VELKVVVHSQAEKIAQLEMACADLKREKESIAAGYQWLSEKHKAFIEKTEHEKTELVEIHATELARLCGDLDLETRSYTEYRQNVRHQLDKPHETIASSFEEIKAQCLPFTGKGTKIEEMIDWVAREVKTVSDTVWQLNENFAILGIEGVLNMLNGEGC
jgi:chromosome segregation ATPase